MSQKLYRAGKSLLLAAWLLGLAGAVGCGRKLTSATTLNQNGNSTLPPQSPSPLDQITPTPSGPIVLSISGPSPAVISVPPAMVISSNIGVLCDANATVYVRETAGGNTLATAQAAANQMVQIPLAGSILASYYPFGGAIPLSIYCLSASGVTGSVDRNRSITLDVSIPPQLASFTATAGGAANQVVLSLGLPADISDYAAVEIHRAVGSVPPSDACAASTLIQRSVAPFPANLIQYTDSLPAGTSLVSYRVCIYDGVGNKQAGNVIAGVTAVDSVAPLALTSFTAQPGSQVGAVKLLWMYPSGASSDYARLRILRVNGVTPPASNCASGTVVMDYAFSAGTTPPTTVEDNTNAVWSGNYSYRACITDRSNNLTSTNVIAGATPSLVNGLPVFVTSLLYPPDLGGLSGADSICRNHAYLPGATVPKSFVYVAMIAKDVSVGSRIVVYKPIYNMGGEKVADSEADLFDGSIDSPIHYNEFGQDLNTAALKMVYTNANPTGSYNSTGPVGFLDRANVSWIYSGIPYSTFGTARLYCLGQ